MNRKRTAALVTGLALLLGVAAYLVVRGRSGVDWASVKAALMAQETIHGQGRVYASDGLEWEFAIWGIVKPDSAYASKGMIIPANPVTEAGPSPEVIRISNAMDYCGPEGLVTELLREGGRLGRARQGAWGGRQVLLAEVGRPGEVWVMAIDPESKLPIGLEMFVLEEGGRRLRGRCEYEYDRPLPAGFEQAPG
jgi:hypothetical protein